MTRDEALARYQAIRPTIRRVLELAPAMCSLNDWTRAAKLLGLQGFLAEDLGLTEPRYHAFLQDVALFEPNQRGTRAYDRFLKRADEVLEPAELPLARAIRRETFSVFRIAGRHESAGIWLEDLFADNRRLWMLDEGLETNASEGQRIATRLFDAGGFHAGLSLVIPIDDEDMDEYRRMGLTSRHRQFVPTVYGDAIFGPLVAKFDETRTRDEPGEADPSALPEDGSSGL